MPEIEVPYPPLKDVEMVEELEARDNPLWLKIIKYAVLSVVLFISYVLFTLWGAIVIGGGF